jgi:predicted PurR-regulated permease PerM
MSTNSKTIAVKRLFYTLGALLMVMVLLYFGRPVLLPVALSFLLAFILTPLVTVLEGWRLGRIPSVLIASMLAFALIGLSTWALALQIQGLAEELPSHRQEIKAKLDSLRVDGNSTFQRLSDLLEDVNGEEQDPLAAIARDNTSDADANEEPAVIPIIVRPAQASPMAEGVTMVMPIVEPLATVALVVVLVMFLLIRREDVRYRVIALIGDAALTGTTRLMQDTAERVSRYLLNLLLVNAGFGIWFGLGLYFLGVPYAPLWGFLTLCFRFIPFLGSPASVLFPLIISIATSAGWSQPIYVLVFFGVSELLTANVIEPVLFGKTTGLTPIALLIAALFWAWIWGPIGLLLSTPLTVCMVVLGQHLPHLRSLKVLLAEQPILDAKLQYFQRLLAGDAGEGKRVFANYAEQFGRQRAFDEVIIPALQWTRRERVKEVITAEEEQFIWRTTEDSIEPEQEPEQESEKELTQDPGKESHDPSDHDKPVAEAALQKRAQFRVCGYPVHHRSEEIALAMLGQSIGSQCDLNSMSTKVLPRAAIDAVTRTKPDAVVLAVIPPGGLPQVHYMCSQINKRCPDIPIIVACFGKLANYDETLTSLRKSGAAYLTTSIAQTTHQILALTDESHPTVTNQDAVVAAAKRSMRDPAAKSTPKKGSQAVEDPSHVG